LALTPFTNARPLGGKRCRWRRVCRLFRRAGGERCPGPRAPAGNGEEAADRRFLLTGFGYGANVAGAHFSRIRSMSESDNLTWPSSTKAGRKATLEDIFGRRRERFLAPQTKALERSPIVEHNLLKRLKTDDPPFCESRHLAENFSKLPEAETPHLRSFDRAARARAMGAAARIFSGSAGEIARIRDTLPGHPSTEGQKEGPTREDILVGGEERFGPVEECRSPCQLWPQSRTGAPEAMPAVRLKPPTARILERLGYRGREQLAQIKLAFAMRPFFPPERLTAVVSGFRTRHPEIRPAPLPGAPLSELGTPRNPTSRAGSGAADGFGGGGGSLLVQYKYVIASHWLDWASNGDNPVTTLFWKEM